MVEQLPYDVCVQLYDQVAWIHKQAVKGAKRARMAAVRTRPMLLSSCAIQNIDLTAEGLLRWGSEMDRLAEGLGKE